VRVSAQDVSGEPLSVEASGLEARVIQHEVDHLDGTLIVQRTTREQRKGALRALREGETYAPPRAEDADEEAQAADPAGAA
jgi:peptide deformylase